MGDTGGVTLSATAPTDEQQPAPRRARRRGWRVGVAVVVLLALGLPAVLSAFVVLTSRTDDRTRTDAVVVLGAAQFWGRPSPVLEARLAQAKSLYDDGVATHVVTVGGNQPGDRTTEAESGKAWLVGKGVRSARVTAVPTGRDTLTSLTAVAALMKQKGWTSATIVTDPVHEARSLAMALALGIDAHGAPTRAGSGSSVTLDYVARETAGLAYFWLVERRDLHDRVAG